MSDVFGAASHDEVLQLVLQVALLLGAARLLGGVARRLGQPAVVGEILAGVVLGPSLLSGLIPWVGEWVLPRTALQGHLLEVVALIGVMLLLVVTGLETDLGLIRRRAGVALGVAIGGLVVPFASGLLLGLALPDELLVDPSRRTVFALFVATALSISAIPVLAKVLMDMGLMRREVGQTMLAAGMIDDITGWSLLGLVTALAGADALTTGTVLRTLATVVLFLLATVTVGNWVVSASLRLVQDRLRGPDAILTAVVVVAFAWGAFSQAIHLEPVIGAFAVGILFGRLPGLPADVVHKLESMAMAVFAPIFFAVAGLKVDLAAILQPRLLGLTVVVLAVATFGKLAGAYAGARLLARQDHWSALAYGSGLNARGAMEIIIATIGLSLGILTREMFSIVVVMAVATSVMAPIGLRFTLARVKPAEEEERRLAREEALGGTFVTSVRRILVPVRPRPDPVGTQTIQAWVIDRLTEASPISTTLFAMVTSPDERQAATQHLRRLAALYHHPPSARVTVGGDPVPAILREAQADYDLVVVGTPTMAEATTGTLFGPVNDDLIKLSPCPTLVVRGSDVPDTWVPTHIVVPTNGTAAARRAADLAFAVAGPGTRVSVLHVVTPTRVGGRSDLATDVTTEMAVIGSKLDLDTATVVVEADDVESGILEAVGDAGVDLIVLGTNVRAGTTRLHLGPRVERVAREAPCPVLILNT